MMRTQIDVTIMEHHLSWYLDRLALGVIIFVLVFRIICWIMVRNLQEFKIVDTDEPECMSVLLPKQVNSKTEHYHYTILIESANAEAWAGIEEFADLLITHESMHSVLNLRIGHDAAVKLNDLPFEDKFGIVSEEFLG